MIIKLNIYNIKDFFHTINECKDNINLLHPDGRKENIKQQYLIQNELLRRYKENKNRLSIALDVPNPKDYMSVVFYYAGDC